VFTKRKQFVCQMINLVRTPADLQDAQTEDRAKSMASQFSMSLDSDQGNAAVAAYMNGNPSAVNDLIAKGAANLGMPSGQMLRDQILPSLGIHFGQ
jgi:hypothetical protein